MFGVGSLASFAGSIQDVKHQRRRKRDELRDGKYELSVRSWARGQGIPVRVQQVHMSVNVEGGQSSTAGDTVGASRRASRSAPSASLRGVRVLAKVERHAVQFPVLAPA